MSIVIAVETRDGVVIAGDSLGAEDGTVTTDQIQRVFDFDDTGAGVVGPAGAIQQFQQTLRSRLKEYRLEHSKEMSVDRLGQIAAEHAQETNVSAVVGTHDRDGRPQLRKVRQDGSVLKTSATALGSGAETALGGLETTNFDIDVEEAVSEIREILGDVLERDAHSGGDIDVWSLSARTADAQN